MVISFPSWHIFSGMFQNASKQMSGLRNRFWGYLWYFCVIDINIVLVKLPQIIKILKSGSARGLNIHAGLLEVICCTATGSYSFYKQFPFSTYGDAVFLAIQSVIISFLTLSWEVSYLHGFTFLSGYVACVAYTVSPNVDFSLLALAQAVNTPVILFSRVSKTAF